MKKKILTAAKIVITITLTIAVLTAATGCSLLRMMLSGFDPYPRPTVKLSQMEYTRPDAEEILGQFRNTVSMIDGSDGKTHPFSYLVDSIYDAYDQMTEWQSMETLAYVHFSIDTSDSKWTEEIAYFDEYSPKISQEYENLFVACAQSDKKAKYEEELFGEGVLDNYVNGGTLTDEIAELMQRESQLVTQFGEYDYMDAVFEVDGISGTIADHAARIQNEDDYNKVYEAFYKRVNQDTGPILIELVKVRNKIAAAAGLESYADFAFGYGLGRDYSPDQASGLVEEIRQKIVPLYKKAQAEGVFDILYDMQDVHLSAGRVNDAVKNALGGADDRLKQSFEFMEEYELCYLGYDSNQLSASYTTYIPKYEAPVTVILGSGDASDVLTLAHEFGHFTDGYMHYTVIDDLDLSEIASTSLEYLFLSKIDDSGLSAKEIDAVRRYKKASTIQLYISQCLYYAFEERLYKLSDNELTPDNVNALARNVIRDFDLESDFEFFGWNWSMIEHFYQQAFYVISYVTADSVSLQIASKEADNAGDGFALYFKLTDWDYSMSFTENLERAGLDSPFSAGAIDKLAVNIQKVLDQ